MARRNNSQNDIKKITDKIFSTLKESGSKAKMRALGEYAILIIVRRTRLGKGVVKNNESPKSLKSMRKHSPLYTKQRKRAAAKGTLSNLTSPARHNLTFTGQLLSSMKILAQGQNQVVIGPSGPRKSTYKHGNAGPTNEEVGQKVHDMGWRFNRLSSPEYSQLLRFYRKTFGDLVRKYFNR